MYCPGETIPCCQQVGMVSGGGASQRVTVHVNHVRELSLFNVLMHCLVLTFINAVGIKSIINVMAVLVLFLMRTLTKRCYITQ